jgi:hypothetical protein
VEPETDRREWRRLNLPLNVHFSRSQQEAEPGVGVTDNVSAGGLYFRTSDWADLAEQQTLTVELSGLSTYNHGALFRTLGGEVTVLRVDPPQEQGGRAEAGVAARFTQRPRVGLYDICQ